jgi:hypothetical protein
VCVCQENLEETSRRWESEQPQVQQEQSAVDMEDYEEDLRVLREELDRLEEDFQMTTKNMRARDGLKDEYLYIKQEYDKQKALLLLQVLLAVRHVHV